MRQLIFWPLAMFGGLVLIGISIVLAFAKCASDCPDGEELQ